MTSLIADMEKAFEIKISREPDESRWTPLYACKAACGRREAILKAILSHVPLSPLDAGVALFALDIARNGYDFVFVVPSEWKTNTPDELESVVSNTDYERDGCNDLQENYTFVLSLVKKE